MNLKFLKKAAAGAAAFLLSAGAWAGILPSLPSMASNLYDPAVTAGASNLSFKKYLIMRAGDTVPTVHFQYSVSAGTGRSLDTGDNSEMEVIAGITPGNVHISNATFTSALSTSSSLSPSQVDIARSGRTNISFDPAAGEKFAAADVSINLSDVTFREPGIYRYVITESLSAADQARGILPDEFDTRILDVYVVDDGSGSLSVATCVLNTEAVSVGLSDTMGSGTVLPADSKKTDGFTSEYHSYDLVFTNRVSGNQASRDKYFHFILDITNLREGERYEVSISADDNAFTADGNADATIGANPNEATKVISSTVTNPTIVEVNARGSISQNFYLQDGQSIAVRGLPANAKYTLLEDEEDYLSSGAVVTGFTDPTTSGEALISTIPQGSDPVVKTSYLNQRAGVIPTGVLLSVAPGLCAVSLGIGGFVLSRVRSRREKDEELRPEADEPADE